ncbi:hypothetical protein BK133_17085 [Paenibacillus sp. FSL H8-0548]|uniref:hypothetical protein n=1 Tax=Paenibacillus sp. FSL H8-0548 TaxID=1920422 RepID=UPI00096FEB32|nr:hypothetical protein BK133_17085 [Paenibacillus sp. FSL H8-0548]
MFLELKSLIINRARSSCQRAQRTGLNIPLEDFVSFFSQGLFQATKGYDNKLGNFLPRYHSYLKLREADVWRCYETRGNNQSDRKYEKARLLTFSLDQPAGNDDSDETRFTLLDIVPTPSAEDSYMESEQSRTLIMEFSKLNKRYALIVELLDNGHPLKEIALLMGESSYNSKVRKLVQRTKIKFSEYLNSRIL